MSGANAKRCQRCLCRPTRESNPWTRQYLGWKRSWREASLQYANYLGNLPLLPRITAAAPGDVVPSSRGRLSNVRVGLVVVWDDQQPRLAAVGLWACDL